MPLPAPSHARTTTVSVNLIYHNSFLQDRVLGLLLLDVCLNQHTTVLLSPPVAVGIIADVLHRSHDLPVHPVPSDS